MAGYIGSITVEDIMPADRECMLSDPTLPCYPNPAIYFPDTKLSACLNHDTVQSLLCIILPSGSAWQYLDSLLMVECSPECNMINGHKGEHTWLDI